MKICLYITSLHCLREICENNHLLYKFFKSQNTDNHILFLNILKKSMISSPVKPVYEANELEVWIRYKIILLVYKFFKF